MGPSPSPRSGHGMASVGQKVFVIGGESFKPLKSEDHAYIHVLDSSEWLFLTPFSEVPANVSQNISSIRRSLLPALQPNLKVPFASLSFQHPNLLHPSKGIRRQMDLLVRI